MALELTELDDQIITKFIFLNKETEQPYVKFVQLKNTNNPRQKDCSRLLHYVRLSHYTIVRGFYTCREWTLVVAVWVTLHCTVPSSWLSRQGGAYLWLDTCIEIHARVNHCCNLQVKFAFIPCPPLTLRWEKLETEFCQSPGEMTRFLILFHLSVSYTIMLTVKLSKCPFHLIILLLCSFDFCSPPLFSPLFPSLHYSSISPHSSIFHPSSPSTGRER